jgi:hypothetical protein
MSISPKNALQEYCQKNQYPMPLYESRSTDQTNWLSSVTVCGTVYHGTKSFTRKTLTENNVAEIAMSSIKLAGKKIYIESKINDNTDVSIKESHTLLTKFSSIEKIDTIYLIDLENKPFNNKTADSNVLFIGFISSIHHSIGKYRQGGWHNPITDDIYSEVISNKNNMLIYDIGGGVSDLSDHFMTMFIYKIVDLVKKLDHQCKIYIISGDHAAYCTRLCLEKALKWSKNINCITSDVINSIQN